MGKSFDDLPNELRQKIFGYTIDTPLPATISETDCLPPSDRRNLPVFKTVHYDGWCPELPHLNPTAPFINVLRALDYVYAAGGKGCKGHIEQIHSLLQVDRRSRDAMIPVLKQRLQQLQAWREKARSSHIELPLYAKFYKRRDAWSPFREQRHLHGLVSRLEDPEEELEDECWEESEEKMEVDSERGDEESEELSEEEPVDDLVEELKDGPEEDTNEEMDVEA